MLVVLYLSALLMMHPLCHLTCHDQPIQFSGSEKELLEM